MQVVLKQDVKGIGKKGDVVKVADGYARNFLFPRNLASPATEGVLRSNQLEKDAQVRRHDKELQAARGVAASVEGVRVEIRAKSGDGGRLFGAVTVKDVAEALESQHGIVVDRKKIALGDPVKTLGERPVEVRIHSGVSAKFTLAVLAGTGEG